MAKRPSKKQQQDGRKTFRLMTWAVMTLVCLVTFPSTTFLVLLGMLPTIVAFFAGRDDRGYAAVCIGSINFVGVYPALEALWAGDRKPDLVDIVFDPLTLTIMYAAAGLGWLLYLSVPPVIQTITGFMGQRRIESLKSDQKALIAEWGDELAEDGVDPDFEYGD